MFVLRPYQQAAIHAVYDFLRRKDTNPCVVLPTAAGKTPVLATICSDAVTKWNGRVLVISHVKELLQQAADKLQTICPDVKVGVYSAGLKSRDTDAPVIVAGIQSVYKRACELDRFDLIIIDEAHLLPPDGEGMYQTFFKDARIVNPRVRLIGLTATPYRLKSGMLCGPNNLLHEICYEIGIREQVRAYRIADNKTAELSEWDMELLPIELSELKETGFDMELLAFGDKELTKLLNLNIEQGLCDPDEIPEPPDEPITQPGDVWILDNHRLMCGDSSKPEDVDKLLAGNIVHMFHGDPPYNVAVESRSNNSFAIGQCSFTRDEDAPLKTSKLRAKDRPIKNDKMSDEEFDRMLDAWFGNIVRVLEPGRAAYFWGGYHNIGNYPAAFKRNGLYFSQVIIWNKLHPVMNRKDFLSCYELCFYCWKEGAAHKFFGPDNERDLWEVKKPSNKDTVHLTEKPVELSVKAITLSSRPGENVLELFGGSGSTLIGCEQTGRNCFIMEIDPAYCDIIVKRWENFTGKVAERITFYQLSSNTK